MNHRRSRLVLPSILVMVAAGACGANERGIGIETANTSEMELAQEQGEQEPGLSCEIALVPKRKPKDDTVVRMKLTNDAATTTSLLVHGLPFDYLPVPVFAVERDGEPLLFHGIHAVRNPPAARDYVVFQPGETRFASYDLSTYFPLDEPGEYTVQLRNEWATTADADLTGQRTERMNCNSLSFTYARSQTERFVPLTHSELMAGQSSDVPNLPGVNQSTVASIIDSVAGQPLSAPISSAATSTGFEPQHYDNCVQWQAVELYSVAQVVWDVGWTVDVNANIWSPTTRNWFGASGANWGSVNNYVDSIVYKSHHPSFNCQNDQWGQAAYVSWDSDFIHVCMPFWYNPPHYTAYRPTSGAGGKLGILAHELAHVAGLWSHYWDSWGQCLQGALYWPHLTPANTPSYEWFYVDVQQGILAGSAGAECIGGTDCGGGAYCWGTLTNPDGPFCRNP